MNRNTIYHCTACGYTRFFAYDCPDKECGVCKAEHSFKLGDSPKERYGSDGCEVVVLGLGDEAKISLVEQHIERRMADDPDARECPHGDFLHNHGDGCPSCDGP